MNFFNKIIKSITTLSAVLLISFLSVINVPKTVQTVSDNDNRQRIIIDAGHGGFDGGAVAEDGTVEKDINLIIATKLQKMLTLSGYEVLMTRETDSATDYGEETSISNKKKNDMQNRLKLINGAPDAIFVSIHLNKFTTSSAVGAQVFYSHNLEASRELGNSIQASLKNNLQNDNERTVKQATRDTYLLYNATIPAVIVECGFLSNAAELRLLKTEEYQSKLAFTIFSGIQEYYNKQEK